MSELRQKRKTEFVAKHARQGNRIIIIIPKDHQDTVKQLKNPMLVKVEEIL
jgi:hypothetical protein